jgi:formylmethanofuran dehydrogenase subunit B
MPETSPSIRVIEDVVCTVCGCVCDDLKVEISGDRVTGISPGCSLAEPWFAAQTKQKQSYRVAGESTSRERAIATAVEILRTAKAPLVYGLSRSSTPGQRAAVRLADQLQANIDTTASTCHAPSIMALQQVGESTSSLGEVRNRSDLIVYWGSNPTKSHPRHMERFVDAVGQFVPGGRGGRHVVVIDTVETEPAKLADTFIQIAPGGDFDFIWALRGLLAGVEIPQADVAGIPSGQLHDFVELLKNCHYGTFFFGLGLTQKGVPHANVESLLRLSTDLNQFTRFTARRMRIPGDVAGADCVLCWQTGFPFSVNLARGFPRYNPGEYTAGKLLERGEVDAVLLVGSEGVDKLTPAAQQTLQRLPVIVLDYPNVKCPVPAAVHFTTAIYGVHQRGTVYRMDEVPIELRTLFDSDLPADEEILHAILGELQLPFENAVLCDDN